MASFDEGFMFQQVTGDYQQVTVQGQVSFRVQDAKKTAALLNFSLASDGKSYRSDDPKQLTRRVLRAIEVLSADVVKSAPLKSALLASDALGKRVNAGLAQHPEIRSLGLEVLGVAIVAIKPTPETAKALEAEAFLDDPALAVLKDVLGRFDLDEAESEHVSLSVISCSIPLT
jgi:regulator of protease activity HflC (stomatin/prohibitin superfamily)